MKEKILLDYAAEQIISEGYTQYGLIYISCDEKTAEAYARNIYAEYLKKHETKKAVSVSVYDLMRELIKAIRDKEYEAFLEKYQKADLLIITGAEGMANKMMTQKEIYVAVDKMLERHSPVVFFSGMLPKNILKLEDRNRAQMEGGLLI